MLLVVGLGNPGGEHANNRHNIGFMAADAIVRRHSFSDWKSKFQGEISEGRIGTEKVLVLKPLTYMNESGRAVAEAVNFYKLDAQDVVVLYDEIDLAAGKVRAKKGGGHAGHNGIRSLISHISADFMRVRLGVGHPGEKDRVVGHVLSDFRKDDKIWVSALLDAISEHLDRLAEGDLPGFMTAVSRDAPPPKQEQEPKKEKDK